MSRYEKFLIHTLLFTHASCNTEEATPSSANKKTLFDGTLNKCVYCWSLNCSVSLIPRYFSIVSTGSRLVKSAVSEPQIQRNCFYLGPTISYLDFQLHWKVGAPNPRNVQGLTIYCHHFHHVCSFSSRLLLHGQKRLLRSRHHICI